MEPRRWCHLKTRSWPTLSALIVVLRRSDGDVAVEARFEFVAVKPALELQCKHGSAATGSRADRARETPSAKNAATMTNTPFRPSADAERASVWEPRVSPMPIAA